MWNGQKKTEKKQSEKTKKARNYQRAYMSSYEWNYFIFGLANYLRETLFDENGDIIESISSDSWLNFRTYCQSQHRDWKAIKDMIEYCVATHFKSEMDLVRHEAFKPFEENDSTLPVAEKEDTCLPMEKKVDTIVPVEKKQDFNTLTKEQEVARAAELECAFRGLSENLSSRK